IVSFSHVDVVVENINGIFRIKNHDWTIMKEMLSDYPWQTPNLQSTSLGILHDLAISYKRDSIWWVMSAKKEETRLRRLGILITSSEAGEKNQLCERNNNFIFNNIKI
ncbi:YdeI/OmpD-associated family protein, partial [Halobacteriovorax sp. JY17]|uniref:YdeI/OmpD-associated family protein n=1 Tax=Halobacteriovorax sp. JY17 TaxID=2014617 RepID=UPI0025B90DC3